MIWIFTISHRKSTDESQSEAFSFDVYVTICKIFTRSIIYTETRDGKDGGIAIISGTVSRVKVQFTALV